MGDFIYEIIEIDESILSQIRERFDEEKEYIEEAKKEFKPIHLSWVKSFESFISILDLYGYSFSDSLASRWDQAGWSRGGSPKDEFDYAIVFSQYLAVVNSLLIGKVKIVKNKIENVTSNSVFHKRSLPLQKNFVFVLMPFTEDWSDYIWKEEIKPIVQGIGRYHLICKRADDLYVHDVMQDIYESILTASIVIADITNRNANVFYELGIAHSLGKEVIILSQGSEYIPFDLNRFRHCIYSNDGTGYKILRQYLPNAIKDILQKQQLEF